MSRDVLLLPYAERENLKEAGYARKGLPGLEMVMRAHYMRSVTRVATSTDGMNSWHPGFPGYAWLYLQPEHYGDPAAIFGYDAYAQACHKYSVLMPPPPGVGRLEIDDTYLRQGRGSITRRDRCWVT